VQLRAASQACEIEALPCAGSEVNTLQDLVCWHVVRLQLLVKPESAYSISNAWQAFMLSVSLSLGLWMAKWIRGHGVAVKVMI